MFIGKVKNIFIKTIPGQAGIVQINPGTSGGSQDVQHTVLSEIRMEANGELILEDGVDLLVAENTSSCYLMVSGEIRYEV